MAYYKGIPIIAIASNDKLHGKLLPSMISIITLNVNDELNFYKQWTLLQNYFEKVMQIIINKWKEASKKELVKQGKNILAFIGGATLIYIFIKLLLETEKK